MKKACIISLVFLLAVSFAVFAGGKQEKPMDKPAAETAKPAAETAQPAAEKPYKGKVIRLAAQADQFAPYMKVLSKNFEEKTGAKVEVDILGYVELQQKITQDYATNTDQYVLATVDIVWTGEFAEKGWTLELSPFIKRDEAEIKTSDILPVMWAMGTWNKKVIAFPMSGYANNLIYNKSYFENPEEQKAFKAAKGYDLKPPTTMKELGDIAEFFTRPKANLYGLVANGARGPAVAQDWMEYMRGFGGQVIDKNGKVVVDSPECLASLKFFVDIFDKWAPPGAIGYWWDDRETAYRTGQAVMQSSWSIARAGYDDTSISMVAGKTGLAVTPTVPGVNALYGIGGWGIGINADSTPEEQAIAWDYIKYITSPEAQKAWLLNDGQPIRRSTVMDPELNAKMPWLKEMLKSYETGDGEYRPRNPQATEIQNILGLRINQAITHELSPEEALKQAAAEIKALF